MQAMKVDLLNLGDAPRVFYDRRNLPIVVGVGKIVPADMSELTLRTIGTGRDTVVVANAGEGVIPPELVDVVTLLATLEFEEYGTLLRRYNEIVKTDDSTQMRPTRAQMRTSLKNVVEDYVRSAARKSIHDDVDPAQLERERRQQQTPPKTESPPPERQPPAHALAPNATPAPTVQAPAHAHTRTPAKQARKRR